MSIDRCLFKGYIWKQTNALSSVLTCRIGSWSGVIFGMDFIRLSKTKQIKEERLFLIRYSHIIYELYCASLLKRRVESFTMLQKQSKYLFLSVVIFPTMKCVLGVSWGTHPDAILAQALPEAIALRIDRYDHMVDSLRDRVLPLQVYPSGKVHDALGQLLHVKRVQSGWANNHLEKKIASNSL